MNKFMLYLSMVGIPVLGLLGVLRIGESLNVPPSIGGIWTIEEASATRLRQSCLPLASAEIAISQSGQYVQVRLGDGETPPMDGRIRDRQLIVRGESACSTPEVACEQSSFELIVELGRSPETPSTLMGSWRIAGCGDSGSSTFRASRRAADQHGG